MTTDSDRKEKALLGNETELRLLEARDRHILFYDGVCGFCNKFVQLVIANDKNDKFCFVSLQSDLASMLLIPRGGDPHKLDTLYLLVNLDKPDERLLRKSDAALFALKSLHSAARPLATILGVIPRPIRDVGYDFIASIRYRLFGKYDQCLLPSAETEAKFLA